MGFALRWVPHTWARPKEVPCVRRWEGAAAQEEPVFQGLLGQSTWAPPSSLPLWSALMWARRGRCPGAS